LRKLSFSGTPVPHGFRSVTVHLLSNPPPPFSGNRPAYPNLWHILEKTGQFQNKFHLISRRQRQLSHGRTKFRNSSGSHGDSFLSACFRFRDRVLYFQRPEHYEYQHYMDNLFQMDLLRIIKKSRYHLLFSVMPMIIIVGAFKIGVHFLGWEVIPRELISFFPSILTGIVFILGFLLAGVVTDYKESEKIPNELASSLFALWQEAEYIRNISNSISAERLISKIRRFVPTLKRDFFILQNDALAALLDSFSAEIIGMGKEGTAPNYIIRMKTEIANLKKTLNRISIIKNTDFIPSVFISIQAITIVFLTVYCLLQIEPWWGDLILVSVFTFIIFSILFLIKDMEDPFEYDGDDDVKSDEISLKVLDDLQKEFDEAELRARD
jgi:hypothetical protein